MTFVARSIDTIRSIIKAKARTFPSLNSLLFSDDAGAIQGSQFISLTETVVQGQQSVEKVAEAVQSQLNGLVALAASGNPAWIQSKILAFQFGDALTIDDNFVVAYATIDSTKQIVTRCSVFVASGNVINIKVAKNSSPPEPLSSVELDALKDYYFGTGDTQGVGFAGSPAVFVNQDPDRLYVEGVIRYLGQFDPAVVKTNVIAAIEAFISTFQDVNFDGTIKMSRLEDAILAVDGVSRFEFATDGIRARPFNIAFAGATIIGTEGFYTTEAGYVISEDTAGETLADKITTSLEIV